MSSFTFVFHLFPDGVVPMRCLIVLALLSGLAVSAQAHHPDRRNKPVYQYIDLIPPLGNRLPASYRRRYNRPTNVGGKIAYWIAPSSQEAMAWHDAKHRGFYRDHRPRIEKQFFYPKPYEALRIGARVPKSEENQSSASQPYGGYGSDEEAPMLEPIPVEPMSADLELIE